MDSTVQERAEQALRQVDPDINYPLWIRLTAIAGTIQDLDENSDCGRSAPHRRPVRSMRSGIVRRRFKFHEEDRPEIKAINIDGVRHILSLVQTVNTSCPAPLLPRQHCL